ncbi:hypothetical protein HMPREF1013_05734 [Bacillus sp. 2_A_57_CT2]|uniref:Uncharacterized protein n=1 Tax=Cytobacillus oceanisediminis TaxID=665099 RepID=A0ABX3CR52_9BACI|nr:hypothetical protein HMPREF1013_05734 [Bacillus sp. 2_A_57_CT2]OHX47104.1 hypothetical protein BBV17_20300 [Cytobacillus oceanisediminis]
MINGPEYLAEMRIADEILSPVLQKIFLSVNFNRMKLYNKKTADHQRFYVSPIFMRVLDVN